MSSRRRSRRSSRPGERARISPSRPEPRHCALHSFAELTGWSVAALVPVGAGGFETIAGILEADGTFRIPAVAAGEYYFQRVDPSSTEIIVTSERSLDLGFVYVGRPDAAETATFGSLLLDLDGLSPWHEYDYIEYLSVGAGAWGSILCDEPIPGGAATVQSDTCMAWAYLSTTRRIDGGRGDSVLMTQLAFHALDPGVDSTTYYSVATALTPPPFTQVDGQPTTLSGTFQAVPQTQISFDWERSLFAAAAVDADPSVTVYSSHMGMYAEPVGDRSNANVAPTLVNLFADEPAGHEDTTLSLSYGNPYPEEWPVVATACVSYGKDITVPGVMAQQTSTGSICTTAPIQELGGVFSPIITPPLDPEMGGQSADADVSGVGTTPVLRWSPPSSGAAGSYSVLVRRFDPMTGLFNSTAALRTRSTSIQIPPGILEPGDVYTVRVTATTEQSYATNHKNNPTSESRAQAMTGIVMP